MSRTVHGFQGTYSFCRICFLIDINQEHMIMKLFPVTRFFPQCSIQYCRRVDFLIAEFSLPSWHVGLHFLANGPSVRMPKNHSRCFILKMEQFHFAAQFAVVSFLCLFKECQIILQVLTIPEGNSVYPLQHLVSAVAPPIGSGNTG